jgi:hypothetical protein
MLDKVPGNRDHFHDTVIAPYKGLLEVWYTEHKNLGLYFLLILLTAWSVLRPGSNVYGCFFKNLPKAPLELETYLH